MALKQRIYLLDGSMNFWVLLHIGKRCEWVEEI